RDTSQLYDSSAAFEPEVRKRTCSMMGANFGFAALVSCARHPTLIAGRHPRSLEFLPSPAHPDGRPALRKAPVREVEGRPRSLQKGLGDKEAQPQARRLAVEIRALPPPVSDVGLADPIHDFRGKARSIIGNRDGDPIRAPGGRDLDPRVGKIDGVLEKVA